MRLGNRAPTLDAGKADQDGKPAWKSVGLSGKVYAHGGGQGPKELELTVDAPPENAEQWKGVSGAPIFVKRELAGLIKEAPRSFRGGRFAGARAQGLLQNRRLSPGAVSPGGWTLCPKAFGCLS